MIRTTFFAAAVAAGGLLSASPASAGITVDVGIGGPAHGAVTPVYHRGYRHEGYRRGYYRAPARVYVAPRRYYRPPVRVYVAPRAYGGGDGCETFKVRVWNGYGYETQKRRRCY